MVQQLHQRRPQPQRLHVIGIIQRLDQLLEVIKRHQLVVQADVAGVVVGHQDLHGGLHEIGLGGPTKQAREHLGGQAPRGGLVCWGVGVGVGLSVSVGVLNAPF